MAGPWRVHALRKMSSCSVTCSPEILPPCYSKHTVFPKKFHACMVPKQQYAAIFKASESHSLQDS